MAVDIVKKVVAEFIGTLLLILTVGCNLQAIRQEDSGGSGVFAALSIGSILMIMIYALGPISGAHFNPAVTISCLLSGKIDVANAIQYILSQLVAGVVGSLSFYALYGDGIPFGPSPRQLAMFKWYHVLTVELLFTFMLCFVVLNTACIKKDNQYFGLAIGFVIVAGGNAGGWISGGAFNPAVSIGLDISDFSASGFGWSLQYAIAQVCGSALAAFLFYVVRPEEFGIEVSSTSYRAWTSRLTCEFVGTFMLVLTVGLNVLQSQVDSSDPLNEAAVFGIAATLMCMIYAVGPVSGGHLNPAVTTAILASGRGMLSWTEYALYILTQMVGGVCGATMYSWLCEWRTFGLGPYGTFSWRGVAASEIIYTFVLTFVVLTTATVKKNSHTQDLFALCIGFSVVAGGYSVGPVSGAAFNPAVAIGIDASNALVRGSLWKFVPYMLLEMFAGVIAAQFFRVTHVDEYEEYSGEKYGVQNDEANAQNDGKEAAEDSAA